MGKFKRKLFLYTISDYKSTEEYLEKMAAKGWLLEKLNWFSAKFRKVEPMDALFTVDFYPGISPWGTIDDERVKEYRNICEDAGWEFITSNSAMQIFYSKKEDNPIPIHTDERVQEVALEKNIKMQIIGFLIFLILGAMSIKNIYPIKYNDLYTNLTMVIPIFNPILLLILILYIGQDIIWIIKSKYNLKRNKPLPRVSYGVSRIRNILVGIFFVSIIIIYLLATILDVLGGNKVSLLAFIPSAIGIIGAYLIKKRGIKEKASDFSIVAGIFIVTFILVSISTWGLSSFINKDSETELMDGYTGFTLKEFIEEEAATTSFKKTSSILVPKKSLYWEGNQNYGLRTLYIDSRNKKIAEYIFNEILKEDVEIYGMKRLSTEGDYNEFHKSYYLERKNEKGDKRETLILLNNKEVIWVSGDIDLSHEENIRIIKDKLLNK